MCVRHPAGVDIGLGKRAMHRQHGVIQLEHTLGGKRGQHIGQFADGIVHVACLQQAGIQHNGLALSHIQAADGKHRRIIDSGDIQADRVLIVAAMAVGNGIDEAVAAVKIGVGRVAEAAIWVDR